MLKSEVQHHFWITKKAVQRKFGSKEDEHVVSSDAELDSKIEIYKGIYDTCTSLNKVLDKYQERLCVLSQEESFFGKFLKEVGKKSKSTANSIMNAGKTISYCGQQRIVLRAPVLRLQHEVDVFRFRAIGDTQYTLNNMEKQRTEYRAALCWMKSTGKELDPDSIKSLIKFRRAQSRVRETKRNFDRMSLDSVQKIDLLAAARCNMFSHALMSYMSELLLFSKKASKVFESISMNFQKLPQYDLQVLKDSSLNNQDSEDKVQEQNSGQENTGSFFEMKDANPPTFDEHLLIEVAKISSSQENTKHLAHFHDISKENKNEQAEIARIWHNFLDFDPLGNAKLFEL